MLGMERERGTGRKRAVLDCLDVRVGAGGTEGTETRVVGRDESDRVSVDRVCGAGIGTDGSGGGRMAERAVRSYGKTVRENMCRRWRWSDIRSEAWVSGIVYIVVKGSCGRDCA